MTGSTDRVTPARRQYLDLKRRHPGALLLFRMGDFYELFDDDAVIAARDLHITLTAREFGKGNRVPMAGVPHHALASYLRRLLAKGHRVAIGEQLSEAGRGLVERDVVRVLSPGTVTDPGLLSARENSYLVALHQLRGAIGLAYVDLSTGEFAVTQFDEDDRAGLEAELTRLAPAEVLVAAGGARQPAAGSAPQHGDARPLPSSLDAPVTHGPARWFQHAAARERLLRHFEALTLEPYGCEQIVAATAAAGAILAYVDGTNAALLPLIRGLTAYTPAAFVALDPHTRRNLELIRAARSGERAGSLLSALDVTKTAMGGRLLRRWLARPLRDLTAINARLDGVDALVRDPATRATVRAALERTGDLERMAGRTRQGSAVPRDLLALAAGLRAATSTRSLLTAPALSHLAHAINPLPDVAAHIERAIGGVDGQVILPGYDAELDGLRAAVTGAQDTLLEVERRERGRTGVRSLKVGYNKVFGYYLELSRAQAKHAPADYVRRQTLANAERFVTPDLKEWEARILRAEEQIAAREQTVFQEVRDRAATGIDALLATAAALAELDVLAAFAEVAATRAYVRPVVDGSGGLQITAGRHPVVEQSLEAGAFIANDAHLSEDRGRLLLITGPNMAGKSTYLRQTALIVLMAQAGSFVPAASARIGVVDRIFTRAGAQDDLAAGASTFLVEMVETAAILRHATRASLLVFDEIGRGTSTYDGLAIARAVVEDVHNRIGARTLFATHFHELTDLADRLPQVSNHHITVSDEQGQVVFLRRLAPGRAARSYGIHVARLAGLPAHVTARAQELLASLEAAVVPAGRAIAEPVPNYGSDRPSSPRALGACPACTAARDAAVAARLAAVSLAATTPMQAINLLHDLQSLLGSAVVCSCLAARPRLALLETAPAVRRSAGPPS